LDYDRPKVKAVVDTNVIAYYVLGTPEFDEEARAFWRKVDDTMAPALWEAELANVIWMSVRGSVLSKEDAPAKLRLAGRLGIHSFSVRKLWQGALQRALESGVAAYDTVFVELAHREQLSLATFDNKLLKTYPDIAKRPKDLM
jgi:predicted nucleic acid-binding protein